MHRSPAGFLTSCATFLLCLLAGSAAQAISIMFAFEAAVQSNSNSMISVLPGETIFGTITFESLATDSDPDVSAGRYQGSSSTPISLGITFDAPNYSASLLSGNTIESVFVGDGFLGNREQYGVSVTGASGLQVFLTLQSTTDPSIFASDSLPLIAPDVSRFTFRSFRLQTLGGVGSVQAELVSLTTIPEPGGFLLLGLGLVGLAAARGSRICS